MATLRRKTSAVVAARCDPAGHRADAPIIIVAGKSVNSKDPLEDKKDDSDLWEAQAAFLGPTLWDKTLPYDPDLKVQEVSTRNFVTYCVLRVVCVSHRLS